jgi:hypothetical protein
VVLDNGRVHYFGNGELRSRYHCDSEQSGSLTIRGHKIQSIALGNNHGVMITMRGVVFGFGHNNDHQLGVVDPSALSGDTVSIPTEVFVAITKFKEAARLPDAKRLQRRPSAQQPCCKTETETIHKDFMCATHATAPRSLVCSCARLFGCRGLVF